jgi:rod shape-determining protein MreD
LVLLGLALVESSWGGVLNVRGVHPDLVLVAVISWTLLRGVTDGLVWAFVGGLCLGLLSSAPFGLTIAPLALVCLLARLGYSRVYGAHIVLPLFLIFPLSVVYYLSCTLLLSLTGRPIAWSTTLVHIILPASLFNIVAMLVLFPLLRRLHRRISPPAIGW